MKQYLLLFLLTLLLFGWFLFSLRYQSGRVRTKELLSPFHPNIARIVDEEQRLSVDSSLTRIFNNKLIVFTRLFIEKYLGIFSANFLFLFGEGQMFFSMWKHGVFYYLDFIFLLLGFCYLFLKRKSLWLFLLALVAIAPLPSAFSIVGTEYAERAILLYPPLIIFIGAGIFFFVNLFKKSKIYFLTAIAFLVILYLFQVFNFMIIYHLRNPIYNSEGSGFSARVLVRYVNLLKPLDKRVVVISNGSLGFFKHYLFYSQILDKETLPVIREKIARREYSWENVYFLDQCQGFPKTKKEDVIISFAELDCFSKEKHPYWLSIPRLGDGGEIFKIYNDSMCRQFSLNRYPRAIKFADFDLEDLTLGEFCQKFITDLTGYSK